MPAILSGAGIVVAVVAVSEALRKSEMDMPTASFGGSNYDCDLLSYPLILVVVHSPRFFFGRESPAQKDFLS